MPYCWKCGTELDEDAKFCHVCGAPVEVTKVAIPDVRKRRTPFLMPVIILIAVLVGALVVAALIFLPLQFVNFTQSEQAPSEADVKMLILDFSVDAAQINIVFENLTDKLVILNVSATGYVGIFAPANPVDIVFDTKVTDNVLKVTSQVTTVAGWPWPYNLDVVCDLYIDPSVTLGINAKTAIGRIAMNTTSPVTLGILSLETTTGAVKLSLANHTTISYVSVATTTGSIEFSCDNVEVSYNASVNLKTTTGSVMVKLEQNHRFGKEVLLNVEATTGGIDFVMLIRGAVGAKIEYSTAIGGTEAVATGFKGTESPLESNNFPAESNFLVNLRTVTGGIHVNANYTP